MKLFTLTILLSLFASHAFALECKMTNLWNGSHAGYRSPNPLTSKVINVESFEECLSLAPLELGQKREIRLSRPRGASRLFQFTVVSTQVKIIVDNIKMVGKVEESDSNGECELKEAKFLSTNPWNATGVTSMPECLELSQSKLEGGMKATKFKIIDNSIRYKVKLINKNQK